MSNSLDSLYNVRSYRPDEDKSFIMATMLRGLYFGDSWFSRIPKDIFMGNYKKILELLLASPNTFVTVACLNEDPSVILGYAVLSSNLETIHWVYVKSAWRKQGVARRLVPGNPKFISHLTALGNALLPKVNNPLFNPFL